MKKKILISAQNADEKRVAIVEGDKLVDFYVEVASREHLKGNIYKGVVARVEPGLQACFVNFGPKKHGFLQLREVMPEFFAQKPEGKKLRAQDVLRKGQELIVQVEKDERDTKGATLTTFVSIPGRYIVMMPGQKMVGVSRKIEDREDRERLKGMFKSLKLPKDMGFILRTAGSDKTGEDLDQDLKYLTKLWSRIQADAKKTKAPALIYKEQDIAVRTVRDYLTSDVSEVLVDDKETLKIVKEFLKKTSPWLKVNAKLYKDKKPIFDVHGLEEQISRLSDKFVHLPSRGYVVFDKTEALTAIDVNSGRSRKEENIEATALKTNLEAADEIARQLRLRDIGGLIIIDFIDMVSAKNRKAVEDRIKVAISLDKAHSDTTGISRFGILEMTRERMRTAYFETVSRKCQVCGGTGVIKTDEMVAVSALREIRMRAEKGDVKSISCRLPVASANYLMNAKRDALLSLEKELGVSIAVTADMEIPAGQLKLEVEKEHTAPAPKHEAKPEIRPEAKPEVKPEIRPETKEEAPHAPEAGAEKIAPHRGRKRRRRRGHRPPAGAGLPPEAPEDTRAIPPATETVPE